MRCAGSIGGAAEACCLQPIDVIKTRLQLDHVGKYKGVILLLVDAAECERCIPGVRLHLSCVACRHLALW